MELPPELETAPSITVPAGKPVFTQGQVCSNYVVLTRGRVKIFARSAAGKEIVLYRVRAGEVCVLTTSCLLSHQTYPAEAVAETDLEARVISRETFNELLDRSKAFREFVFASFGARLADLINVVQQVALESVEERLVKYLLIHCDEHNQVKTTQQDIALEIGSAREVVSRHLRPLEKHGWLSVERGIITLMDKDALQQLLRKPQ